MKIVNRLRWVGLLLTVLALVHPTAFAQPRTDADAGAPATPDATVLTAGAPDPASTPEPRPAPTPAATPSAPTDAVFGSGSSQQTVAPRPARTAQQVEEFRTLENEVMGFLERGGRFRDSINGLLSRHHDRQLARLRAGFDRQIAAERTAEGEARRHAIDVFLRFLETYPEDAERTPDVMFRLAELYFDESAYAKLEADERADQMRNERLAQGLPTEDIQSTPVDYRCSVLLYRHIVTRFPRFRLQDSTHYLLGWVLKEMGHEDEAMTSYRGLVCPSRFHYEGEHGFDLAAPLQPVDQPVICGRLFDILRPRAPQLMSPAPAVESDAGVAPAAPYVAPPANDTIAIPTDYAQCQPLNGPNNQPSRYAGETWYFIGDYHFDNARDDEGNALSIAAYQASMRASERRRPVVQGGRTPTAAIQGAGQTANEQPEAARAQFDPQIEYGQFWSKALYKIGWAFFRMTNGYPAALRNFAYLLDYYDFVGAEAAAQGNRTDTLKWVGVIFTESEWGIGAGDEASRCQQVVDQVAHPPSDAPRPFDCSGIIRIVSPADAMSIATAREGTARATPVPGRPAYIAQDRPWTPEAYLELANNYFQQTKYYEAITLYRIFLQLYPLHFRAPRVAESIAIAYERQRQFDQAIAARGRLAQFTEGSAWWNSNNNHPDAQREADMVARNSLHDTAILHHQNAGRLRQEAAQLAARARTLTGAEQVTALQSASERLRSANEEYQAAVLAYGQFIQNYPNDEAAYEFRYNRADALYWSRRYDEAARAYGEVRESNENDQYLAPAAYMAVKSQELHVRNLAQRRQLDPCLAVRAGIAPADLVDDTGATLLTGDQAASCVNPPTSGAPGANGGQSISELTVPEPVRDLMAARIAYAQRVPGNLDNASALRDVVQVDDEHPENNPPYRPKFAYLNARTLMRFGHIGGNEGAEQLYRNILRVYCQDRTVAGATFADLNNIMVLQNRQDDLEALAREQTQSTCQGVDTNVAGGILTDARFRHAMDVYRQAERAPASEAVALYERAATEMQEAVNANRQHPQAALAMFYTALAYERTNRFDTATQTYIRIIQDYNNTRSASGDELAGENLAQRINILEQSNFRAAVNLERIFDYDRSLQYYGNVVNDARFANAEGHGEHVHDALASIALTNTNLARWSAARTAWQNFLPRANAGRERAEAEFRVAEIPYRAGNWSEAVSSLQDYLRRATSSADNAQFRVQAQYNIALAYQRQGNATQYRRALREVVTVFQATGQQPGSTAAAWAAEALFRDLDDQTTEFRRNQFQRGEPTALRAQLETFKTQLRAIDESARRIVALRGGEYSVGALVRQGQAHEHLAQQERRIADLVVIPRADQQRLAQAEQQIARLRSAADQLERVNRQDQADRIRQQADELEQRLNDQRSAQTTQVQQAFDQEADAETQLAIINYGTAIHTARSNNIPTQFSAEALRQLRSEDNQRLQEQALTQQRAFPYQPGMFNGGAPGAVLQQQTPVAAPGIARD